MNKIRTYAEALEASLALQEFLETKHREELAKVDPPFHLRIAKAAKTARKLSELVHHETMMAKRESLRAMPVTDADTPVSGILKAGEIALKFMDTERGPSDSQTMDLDTFMQK